MHIVQWRSYFDILRHFTGQLMFWTAPKVTPVIKGVDLKVNCIQKELFSTRRKKLNWLLVLKYPPKRCCPIIQHLCTEGNKSCMSSLQLFSQPNKLLWQGGWGEREEATSLTDWQPLDHSHYYSHTFSTHGHSQNTCSNCHSTGKMWAMQYTSSI